MLTFLLFSWFLFADLEPKGCINNWIFAIIIVFVIWIFIELYFLLLKPFISWFIAIALACMIFFGILYIHIIKFNFIIGFLLLCTVFLGFLLYDTSFICCFSQLWIFYVYYAKKQAFSYLDCLITPLSWKILLVLLFH